VILDVKRLVVDPHWSTLEGSWLEQAPAQCWGARQAKLEAATNPIQLQLAGAVE
jgi:hypothetical protein